MDPLLTCPVCLDDFECDPSKVQDKKLSRLPIQSAACTHKKCCSCLVSWQAVKMSDNPSQKKPPKWFKCPTCKASTAFNAIEPKIDIFACECIMRIHQERGKEDSGSAKQEAIKFMSLTRRLTRQLLDKKSQYEHAVRENAHLKRELNRAMSEYERVVAQKEDAVRENTDIKCQLNHAVSKYNEAIALQKDAERDLLQEKAKHEDKMRESLRRWWGRNAGDGDVLELDDGADAEAGADPIPPAAAAGRSEAASRRRQPKRGGATSAAAYNPVGAVAGATSRRAVSIAAGGGGRSPAGTRKRRRNNDGEDEEEAAAVATTTSRRARRRAGTASSAASATRAPAPAAGAPHPPPAPVAEAAAVAVAETVAEAGDVADPLIAASLARAAAARAALGPDPDSVVDALARAAHERDKKNRKDQKRQAKFESMLGRLREYREANGHVDVRDQEDKELARWVAYVRRQLKLINRGGRKREGGARVVRENAGPLRDVLVMTAEAGAANLVALQRPPPAQQEQCEDIEHHLNHAKSEYHTVLDREAAEALISIT